MESKNSTNVKLSVRPSWPGDCVYLAKHLREADQNEVQAVCGECNLEALVFSWAQTPDPLAIVEGETPAGIFGVVPVEPGVGAVWLVGTDAITHGRWSFLRESRQWLDLLFNYVDERNTVHLRWIEWLGFTFVARHTKYGYEQRPFLEFVRIV